MPGSPEKLAKVQIGGTKEMNEERCVRWLKALIVLVALAIGGLLASGLWLAHAMEDARPRGGEGISRGTTGGW
jgi:hypothetical protein